MNASQFLKAITAVGIAALADSARNILRPMHNFNVLVGKEREKSISEIIDEARSKHRLAAPTAPDEPAA